MSESQNDPNIYWVEPEMRGILPLNQFHISKSLKKIVESFGVYLGDSTRIKIIPDESLGVDVTIIIGKDYTSFSELNNYISAEN